MRIGADPEVFWKRGKSYISSVGKIGGSKENPLRLMGGFALQEDNVTVEYNIPPCKNANEFVFANRVMLDEIGKRANEFGCEVAIVSSAIFSSQELDTPAAQLFGCDPDFNVWSLEPNPRPQSDNANLRSAGGHIHVEFQGTIKQKVGLIRALDLYVGTVLARLDPESQRRELYGRAGACRFKDYGVEYRTPSNVWLRNEEFMAATFVVIESVIEDLAQKAKVATDFEERITKAINELDNDAYKVLIPIISDYWPSSINRKVK